MDKFVAEYVDEENARIEEYNAQVQEEMDAAAAQLAGPSTE